MTRDEKEYDTLLKRKRKLNRALKAIESAIDRFNICNSCGRPYKKTHIIKTAKHIGCCPNCGGLNSVR